MGGVVALQWISTNFSIPKAFVPIEVTLLGIVILVRLSQSEKAASPMDFTLLGIVTLVKFLQLKKTSSSIVVTLSGIVIFSKLEHPVKALFPMVETFSEFLKMLIFDILRMHCCLYWLRFEVL